MANQLNLNSASLEELKAKAAALPEFVDTTDATATASDMLEGETAYVNGQKVTGNIPTKTASNLSASGATVTVPAGYYASQATKSVTTATQATPSVSIDANGKITATSTQSAGYVSAGTKTGTKQMTVQAAKTITPTKSSQTAVAKNVYTTGVVTVGAIPDQYQDITTPLAELNAANGGTAATTIGAAVDNTEAHASSQEAMIAQIISTLDGKIGGESNLTIATASTTLASDNFTISFTGVNKQPKLFIVHSTIEQFSMDTTKNLCCVFYNGTTTIGISGRRGTLAPQIFYDTGGYTWTYSNGTLTVSSSDGYGEFTADVPFLLTYIA